VVLFRSQKIRDRHMLLAQVVAGVLYFAAIAAIPGSIYQS